MSNTLHWNSAQQRSISYRVPCRSPHLHRFTSRCLAGLQRHHQNPSSSHAGRKGGAPVIRQEPSRRGRLGLQQGMKIWTKQLQLQASVQGSRFRRSVTIPAAARMKQRMGWIHPAKHCAVLPKIPHLEPLPKTSRRCRCSTALTSHQKSRERQWPLKSATSLSKRQWKPDKPSQGRPFC